jgi:hypothetical protein
MKHAVLLKESNDSAEAMLLLAEVKNVLAELMVCCC